MRTEQRLIVPGLAPFYASDRRQSRTRSCASWSASCFWCMSPANSKSAQAQSRPISWPRTGSSRVWSGPTSIIALELIGGACLVVGLFTRFFAAALAIEMLIALHRLCICQRVMRPVPAATNTCC